jgi:hypothetical protein
MAINLNRSRDVALTHYRSVAIANLPLPIDLTSERLTSVQVNARERSWPSLWVNWGVACRAVKVAAIFEPDNLKALWNAVRMRVPSVRLRKPSCAGLSAIRTPKIFNPMVENDHPPNIRLWMSSSSRIQLKRRGTRRARADWSHSRRP